METVKERAIEYAERNFGQADMSIQLAAGAGYQAGYKAGASIQRIIEQEVRLKKREDVAQEEYDRQNSFFMDWYFKRKGTPTYSDAIEWARKEAIKEAHDWFSNYLDYLNMGVCDVNDWLMGFPESGEERFRKAMKE